MANMKRFLFLMSVATLSAMAADETAGRLDRAAAVVAKLTAAPHEIVVDSITILNRKRRENNQSEGAA
jgi:hypothetical protein